jgi:tRNA pseudouridine38-40 synthase
MKYFAKIKYLGRDFHGFQVQPDKRTVQGELSRAFFEYFGTETKITGCSRTDAGVHANEFCITLENELASTPPDRLPVAIAKFLPSDISLIYAEECEDDFHVRYDVKSKEYVYLIKNSKVSDPFFVDRAWLLTRIITDDGLLKMRLGAEKIVGERDFKCFMAEGSPQLSTVREIYYINVEKEGDIIKISISANGFLYNMVRIIVGTLVEIAFDRIAPENIPSIIFSKKRALAGPTAPPEGLYLNKVIY